MSVFQEKLGSQERRAGISLALIYAFRMLGLFMILPVFAIYAEDLPEATPMLTGLALGIYGLTQAVLQIPFGMLSDKIGRKPVIAGGLLIFAVGSLVAASADGIYGIIVGRALQGSGAIAAALMALAADLSTEEHRMRMMALIGMSIGAAFAASMVLGPVLNEFIGVSGIFAGTAVLAIMGIGILYLFVPNPPDSHFHRDAELQTSSLKAVLKTVDLLRLDAGIFALHFVLMSVFLVIPLELRDDAGLASAQHWQLYLPVFIVSVILMVPFILLSERKDLMKPVFVGSIAGLIVAVLGLLSGRDLATITIFLLIFFTAFNLLEASLPSLIAKTANAEQKGTAMGVYSSSQFMGAFAGGAVGGLAHNAWGIDGAYMTALAMLSIWLLIAVFMKKPRNLSTYLMKVTNVTEQNLLAVRGVVEVAIIKGEGVAYLKVQKNILDEEKLLSMAVKDS
ncbi:MAG: MFS transporter [Gammaproteobacteria bacterium]|nr:MFS transporter [Gammaproteobacteria bacterium]